MSRYTWFLFRFPGIRVQGFRVWGFDVRVLGFRGLGFRGVGIRVEPYLEVHLFDGAL